MSNHLLAQADARRIPLRDGSVHCVTTSPPYWSLRDYGVPGQIGLEPTPAEYVAGIVAVFRQVWRVLRNDGTVWLNLGDSYSSGGRESYCAPSNQEIRHTGFTDTIPPRPTAPGLKPKDLVGIPWRVALALQADGWTLRSEIIWAKPNPMPESVTDRPTKSHEQMFLLAKGERYFYDADAIREEGEGYGRSNWNAMQFKGGDLTRNHGGKGAHGRGGGTPTYEGGRNRRSVWTVPTTPFPGAHFATFPPKLIEPCIKAGTSEHGCCPECGSPWERVVEREPMVIARSGRGASIGEFGRTVASGTMVSPARSTTTGWRPTCQCNAGPPVPAIVLDPFSGAGTTLVVANALGRHGIGFDLSRDYLRMGLRRLERPHAPVERPSVANGAGLPLFANLEALA